MGMFDDVVVNAKSAAATVSKKAGDLYDNTKLRLSAASLRGEINKKYQALGEAVYNNHSEQIQNDIKAEIADLMQNLNEIDEIIASSKNSVICPNCGEHLSKDAQFCSSCGSPLQVNDILICNSCGSQIQKDSKFCTNCGKPINNEQTAE